MSELRLPVRVPRIDVLALVGVAIGFGLFERSIAGYLVLPLALLAPFVLRETGIVDDDERVRDAWRKAGFWAFTLAVMQAFVSYGIWLVVRPESEGIAASLGPVVHVWALQGPVVLFMVVYTVCLGGVEQGARLVLWALALLMLVEQIGKAVVLVTSDLPAFYLRSLVYFLPVIAGFVVLGFLVQHRRRLAGALLLLLTASHIAVFVMVFCPPLKTAVPNAGHQLPIHGDAMFPVVTAKIAVDLVLVVLAVMLLRDKPEDSP